MLISLPVLSPEQIYVPISVEHDISHRGPITLLEPLVVLIGRHKVYARENISNENGERRRGERWNYGQYGAMEDLGWFS
jgi:hypothetical protein